MNATSDKRPNALVTDLDGTLIPLANSSQNRTDLDTLSRELQRTGTKLAFCTGRHFASVMTAIHEFRLPEPDWLLCDVGTSIRRRVGAGEFEPVREYEAQLEQSIHGMSVGELRSSLRTIQHLRLQEDEKQGRFKLSYYADAARLREVVSVIAELLEMTEAPFSIIHSIDPFTGVGLIDFLPRGSSKAHALSWWAAHLGMVSTSVVFAGDSGNDYAALVSGCRAILVKNADSQLARRVHEHHRDSGWTDRLYLARESATSGVLEGARWFGLFDG